MMNGALGLPAILPLVVGMNPQWRQHNRKRPPAPMPTPTVCAGNVLPSADRWPRSRSPASGGVRCTAPSAPPRLARRCHRAVAAARRGDVTAHGVTLFRCGQVAPLAASGAVTGPPAAGAQSATERGLARAGRYAVLQWVVPRATEQQVASAPNAAAQAAPPTPHTTLTDAR